jgi:uncharacterized alkaline shock family protein YloU
MSDGKTTIAPEILVTIARLTTLSVPGVSRLADPPPSVNRLFTTRTDSGVQIEVRDDTVYATLNVILVNDVNIRDVSHNIQRQVARAISEMVGMNVGQVDVHIADIDYPEVSQ